MRSKKLGLVLEGGSLRALFTVGVLDFFLEKDLSFDYVVGVSAGSSCLSGFLSKQKNYIKDCMVVKDLKDRFFGFYQFLKSGHFINLDKVYINDPMSSKHPFDYQTFFNSKTEWEMVVSNIETGEAEYLTEKEDPYRAGMLMKASSSLPAFTKDVKLDGKLYSDGGSLDSIPLERAIDKGCDKNVVVLTRQKGHIAKTGDFMAKIFKWRYRKYPKFLAKLLNREAMYKKQMALVESEERKGKAFILRPTIPEVARMEKDYNKLLAFYNNGYEEAKKHYDELIEFLKG